MLKAKVPRSWVKRVLEVDGKDARILDLDPDRPLEQEQSKEEKPETTKILTNSKNAALEALFAKRAALDKEHTSDNIPPKTQNSALEALFAKRAASIDNKETSKPPKSKNSALEALFAKRAEAMDQGIASKPKEVPIKNDPDYQKYFKMLKVGLPIGSVKQALMRDGKDPSIADMDPEKSFSSQTESAREVNDSSSARNDVPLKDSEEYGKFFKV
ncbi:hypothetical protein ACHAXS_005767 [Conticribra weissflogii]